VAPGTLAEVVVPFVDERRGFLDRLSPADRDALVATGREHSYRRDAVVFHEGDRSGYAVLIVAGRVKIVTSASDGTETVLSLRGPGDLVGEMAVIDDPATPRSATVVAIEPLRCRVLLGVDLLAYFDRHPRAMVELLRMLAARLRASDQRRVEHGAYTTTHRLAALLVELADAYGRPDDLGLRVEAGLSQVELAGLVGASRESVARGLALLRDKGYIATGRRSLLVRNLAGLRAFAR
jgi:CRP/FNR family transcriptional regulator, cyclic AMP receptor protein